MKTLALCGILMLAACTPADPVSHWDIAEANNLCAVNGGVYSLSAGEYVLHIHEVAILCNNGANFRTKVHQ